MDALPRRLRVRCTAALLALAAASCPLAADSNLSPPAQVFSIDRRIGDALQPALEAAARKASDSRCQEVLSDFTDGAGRRLDADLAATGQSFADYLGFVVFADGRTSQPCANRQVMAWTTPGSRAVRVCWDQFASVARTHRGEAANLLLHETLHTLGLGEGPPDSREITAKVALRCGH